ncbi:hypothetical protein Tco_1509951 [Tanacetum coccineum]
MEGNPKKSMWESYKHMMELFRKPGIITDIKVTNTKPYRVTIICVNDDTNYEVMNELKWGLFDYKDWEMMLVVLHKLRRVNVFEQKKTSRNTFKEIREHEIIIGINNIKPLSLQDPLRATLHIKMRKISNIPTDLGQFIDALH